MKGTSFEVTRAMLWIPPMMTTATRIARTLPKSQPQPAAKLSLPPVASTNCT